MTEYNKIVKNLKKMVSLYKENWKIIVVKYEHNWWDASVDGI